jgi:hypothetical protein
MNRRSFLRLIGLAPVAAPMVVAAVKAAPAEGAKWVVGVDITRHGATAVASLQPSHDALIALGAAIRGSKMSPQASSRPSEPSVPVRLQPELWHQP